MDDVYIVEIAATGEKGMPKDTVIEVAVCRMFQDGSEFETVYYGRVATDPRDLGKEALDRLVNEYGIEPEGLYMGDPEDEVVKGLQNAVFGKECTSFDVNMTFGRFLCFEPWDTTGELTLLPSYSVRLDRDLRNPPEGESPIPYAYSKVCPDDPAGVGVGRTALDLAQMSASIMCNLRCGGFF